MGMYTTVERIGSEHRKEYEDYFDIKNFASKEFKCWAKHYMPDGYDRETGSFKAVVTNDQMILLMRDCKRVLDESDVKFSEITYNHDTRSKSQDITVGNVDRAYELLEELFFADEDIYDNKFHLEHDVIIGLNNFTILMPLIMKECATYEFECD
jgi:hypothetical protein